MERFFWIFFGWTALQRLTELQISRRNCTALERAGYGRAESSTRLGQMVATHSAWFAAMAAESLWFPCALPTALRLLGAAAVLAGQAIRVWCIETLRGQWNITVMQLHSGGTGTFVSSGPYRFVRHPNYLAVIIEIAGLPIMGGAPLSAVIFSALNGVVLARRIRVEDQALFCRPGYREALGGLPALLPRLSFKNAPQSPQTTK